MKIKVSEKSYKEVLNMPRPEHIKPTRQSGFLRWVLKMAGSFEMKATHFTYEKVGMERLKVGEPCLILMNHSSFTDLSIAATLLCDRPYHIVCTNDGFVGKAGLMRAIGCVPTKKFITDLMLLRDMKYVLGELKESVLMFPEAGYSFDGTSVLLPESLGKCLKMMKVPLVMIRADGAFLRDPLYNNLQKRNVKTSARMTYLLSAEEIEKMSVDELNQLLRQQFDYDHFKDQYQKQILVKESFRADGLHRVLYKCPHCLTEGQMLGEGIRIGCLNCGCGYELTEDGRLVMETESMRAGVESMPAEAEGGPTGSRNAGVKTEVTASSSAQATDQPAVSRFDFVSDWYRWQRECVKKSCELGEYRMQMAVDIYILFDHKSLYHVGEGELLHDGEGFHLTGCDGKLDYHHSPMASYSLNADYYWYEIGDMISIGDEKMQFVCFPKDQKGTIVSKARLAAEELHRLGRSKVSQKTGK